MKLRAIGTGSKFCKHPLTPSSFLVISDQKLTLIGAPVSSTTALEKYGYDLDNLSVITFLSPHIDQIGGIIELAHIFKNKKKKPILSAPAKLLEKVRERIEPELGFFLNESFDVKSSVKIHIKEEFFTETIVFVPSFINPSIPSFAVRLESAKIFITGETAINEDWLFKEVGNDLILHSCRSTKSSGGVSPFVSEIQELPVYLQTKIWVYGYDISSKDLEQPFPMMYLPPGSWVFDSERRDRLLSKDRFIRENSRKQY
jgi:hypothetical protein